LSNPAGCVPLRLRALPKRTAFAYGAAQINPAPEPAMADHAIPHFHNDPGVATIKVGVKEFMCVGARPPFDHPHIFIDMGGDVEAICGYCSTRFVYDSSLGAHSLPAECEFTEA
jgi:uncharacterized Zn-finger protein